MTIGMLPWVAKDGNATSYSFSVATYGKQCQTNPYLADDGDGIAFVSGCPGTVPSSPTYLTNTNFATAHVPLADTTGSGPAGTVYRDAWVQALAHALRIRSRTSMTWITRSTYGAARTVMSIRIRRHTTNCETPTSAKPA